MNLAALIRTMKFNSILICCCNLFKQMKNRAYITAFLQDII